jgi:hypothetical protein
LIVVESVAEAVRPGFFRKHAAFRVGDRIVPSFSVHDHQWLVKQGAIGVATTADYLDEERLIATNPDAGFLMQAFQAAGIEYGRVDYGWWQGRRVIYEINTNPDIVSPGPHPDAVRVRNIATAFHLLVAALQETDSPDRGQTRHWTLSPVERKLRLPPTLKKRFFRLFGRRRRSPRKDSTTDGTDRR